MENIDLTEFYRIAKKYENVKLSPKEINQIERNNELIAKIINTRIPDVNRYDQYAAKLDDEIKEMEDYLQEHNEYLAQTTAYVQHVSSMRKQVNKRADVMEKKIKTKYEPKFDKALDEAIEIKHKNDDIPKQIEQLQKEHDEYMKQLDREIELAEAQTTAYYYKEKENLIEIAKKDEEIANVQTKIDSFMKDLAVCKEIDAEVEVLTKKKIPEVENSIAAYEDELKAIANSIEQEKLKYTELVEQQKTNDHHLQKLEDEFAAMCVDEDVINDRIQALLQSKSFEEMEAEECLKDLIQSDYYKGQKEKILSLQSDCKDIDQDLENVKSEADEIEKEYLELLELADGEKFDNKMQIMRKELSELVEDEMEATDEALELKREIEAAMRDKQEYVADLESQIVTLENLIHDATIKLNSKFEGLKEKNEKLAAQKKLEEEEMARKQKKEEEMIRKQKEEEEKMARKQKEEKENLAKEQEEIARNQELAKKQEEIARKKKEEEEIARKQQEEKLKQQELAKKQKEAELANKKKQEAEKARQKPQSATQPEPSAQKKKLDFNQRMGVINEPDISPAKKARYDPYDLNTSTDSVVDFVPAKRKVQYTRATRNAQIKSAAETSKQSTPKPAPKKQEETKQPQVPITASKEPEKATSNSSVEGSTPFDRLLKATNQNRFQYKRVEDYDLDTSSGSVFMPADSDMDTTLDEN